MRKAYYYYNNNNKKINKLLIVKYWFNIISLSDVIVYNKYCLYVHLINLTNLIYMLAYINSSLMINDFVSNTLQ